MYRAKKKISVLVFLECLEEYSEKNFRCLHIFATKSCIKVPASATLNEDDRELLSLGPEQAVTSLQGLSTLHFSVSLFFRTKSIIFGVNNPKNDRVCMEVQGNIEMNWRGE